jgi:hypothetical protein
MTLVPVRLPVHACVPEPEMSVFPSAVLTVRAALVGTTLPATVIDSAAPEGGAAASAKTAAAREAIGSVRGGRCIVSSSRSLSERARRYGSGRGEEIVESHDL